MPADKISRPSRWQRFVFARHRLLRLAKGDLIHQAVKLAGRVQKPLGLRAAQRAGEVLGRATSLVAVKARRTAVHNLTHAFGDALWPAERRRLAREVFANVGRTAVETLRLRHEGHALLKRLLPDMTPLGPLQTVVANGTGAVVLTPHMGNFELLPPATVQLGLTPGVVMTRERHPRLNRLLYRLRSSLGVRVFFQQDGLEPLLRWVRDGHLLGVVPDQDIDRLPGRFVEFFGRPAYTPVGPVALAVLTRTPVYCVFSHWTGEHYVITLEGPLDFERSGRPTEVIEAGTAAWTRAFEAAIRAHPTEWWWFHPRWKTTPESLARKTERRLARHGRPRPARPRHGPARGAGRPLDTGGNRHVDFG